MSGRLYISVICASLAVCASYIGAYSKIIEPNSQSKERSILTQLSTPLEKSQIDVAFCCSTDHPLQPSAVRLAPLADYKPNHMVWGDQFDAGSWSDGFKKGFFGIIAAVPDNKSVFTQTKDKCESDAINTPQDACEFIKYWLSSSKEKRVFIAFTRADFDSAQKIKAALEESGYKAFLFLKGKDAYPWADPSLVGEIFAQAAFRLVVDSENARGSRGVSFEALCCAYRFDSMGFPPSAITKILQSGR